MNKAELVELTISCLSEITNIPSNDLRTNTHLTDLGLDSLTKVGFTGMLSEKLKIEIDTDVVFRLHTIENVVNHIESMLVQVDVA